ncbi:hypothetical protein IMSAGC019_03121 [Lachnospiraceae bacterium]|nr:hypothetical protein IMSAGC019_03121 [Lachnospiraceae bacterium]
MKLEELLSKELYEQVKAAIDAANEKEPDKLKHIRYADLSEGNYVSKEKYASLETDNSSIAEQLKTAQGLIEQLKSGTKEDEALQGKITEYETTVQALQKQLKHEKLESAVKIALLSSGCKDVDYITFKLKEKGELSLDGSGKVKGMDDKIAALKTQFPAQFGTPKGNKIKEDRLPGSDDRRGAEDAPRTLAEALRQKYENPAE